MLTTLTGSGLAVLLVIAGISGAVGTVLGGGGQGRLVASVALGLAGGGSGGAAVSVARVSFASGPRLLRN